METLNLNPHQDERPMMECGHTANGQDSKGNPVCVICYGINAEDTRKSTTVMKQPPDLTGRKARCLSGGSRGGDYGENRCQRGTRCHCETPSSFDLPFFAYRPGQAFDEFYCGCWGWD